MTDKHIKTFEERWLELYNKHEDLQIERLEKELSEEKHNKKMLLLTKDNIIDFQQDIIDIFAKLIDEGHACRLNHKELHSVIAQLKHYKDYFIPNLGKYKNLGEKLNQKHI